MILSATAEKTVRMISNGLVLLPAAVFLAWSASSGPAETPRRVKIDASRFTYNPNEITLKKGEPVVLVLHSTDVTHGLKIAELNIEMEEIKRDKDSEIHLTPEVVGQFVGKCAHFCGKGHRSMMLRINVVE